MGLDDETVGWLFTGGVGTLGEVLLQMWSLPIPHAHQVILMILRTYYTVKCRLFAFSLRLSTNGVSQTWMAFLTKQHMVGGFIYKHIFFGLVAHQPHCQQ